MAKYSNYEGDPTKLQVGDTVGKKLEEGEIPPAPSGVSVDENMEEAKEMSLFDFYNAVRNGGKWDYKQQGRGFENFGNFNFGATGKVLLPGFILKRGAGWAQEKAGTSLDEWGHFYWKKPYGDHPVDQKFIQQGIDYFITKKTNRILSELEMLEKSLYGIK